MTLVTYLQQVRITHTKGMLLFTDKSIELGTGSAYREHFVNLVKWIYSEKANRHDPIYLGNAVL